MLSACKAKQCKAGKIDYYTAPLVINRANIDIANLSLFDYVTQGISSDIGFDYVMSDETELNFD